MAALYILVLGLFGLGLGPSCVALVTDYILHDGQAVRWSILIVNTPLTLVVAALLWSIRVAYHRAEEQSQARLALASA